MSEKLYAQRDPMALEPFYSRHVLAMTAEGLHDKHDIAEELAFRDAEIERLRAKAGLARCMYCDAEFTLATQKEELADHILGCEKSPLVQAIAQLTAEKEAAERECAEMKALLRLVRPKLLCLSDTTVAHIDHCLSSTAGQNYVPAEKIRGVAEAVEGVLEFADHKPDCGTLQGKEHPSFNLNCTCGHNAAYTKAEQALSQLREVGKGKE